MKLLTLAILAGALMVPASTFAQEVPLSQSLNRQEAQERFSQERQERQAQRIDRACERILGQEERILARISERQNRSGSFFENRDGRAENRLENRSDRRDNRDERGAIRFESLRTRFSEQVGAVDAFEASANQALDAHRTRVDAITETFLNDREGVQNQYRNDMDVYWNSARMQAESLFANGRELCEAGNTEEGRRIIQAGLEAIRTADQGVTLPQVKQDIDALTVSARQEIESSRQTLRQELEAARDTFLAAVGQ